MHKKAPRSMQDARRRVVRRDPAVTREKILEAGIAEFCARGYSGAGTARIAQRANCNIRMIYHYYGSKEGLYIAALEQVYGQIRAREGELDFLHMGPVEGITALVDVTFDHMAGHQEFVHLAAIENMQRGRYLRKSKLFPNVTTPLVSTIAALLQKGEAQGVFRGGVDPIQLYVSILSLSYTHLSNRYTLSITYGQDLGSQRWLAARRLHVREMVLGYLVATGR